MLRRVAVVLVFAVTLAIAGGLVVSSPGDHGSDGTQLATGETEEFDRTIFRIEVFENGDARWTVEHNRVLEDDEEESQFREFAETFRTEETEAFDNFRVRADVLTESGSETTDREMAAVDFDRDAYVDPLGQTRGVVEMSFLWENFAEVDGTSVVVGDVFGGGWGIVDDQRLTIAAGEQLVFSDVAPDPDSMTVTGSLSASESVTWFGERQFADERPRIIFRPHEEATNGEVTPTSTPDDGTEDDPDGETDDEERTGVDDDEDGDESDSWMMPIAVVIILLVAIGAGVAWYQGVLSQLRERGGSGQSLEASTSKRSSEGTTKATIPEEELLSDEDRVLQLLERNGGRMKQVKIVDETEWSKSKVSMLLSEMEDDGQISKLRVGRENIISLAGEEPDAAGSPFDDE